MKHTTEIQNVVYLMNNVIISVENPVEIQCKIISFIHLSYSLLFQFNHLLVYTDNDRDPQWLTYGNNRNKFYYIFHKLH
jgi:hypothetical protein